VSIATVVSVVATGRYEMAILLPKKDEDAINVAALSMLIVSFFTLISFLIVFFFNSWITEMLKTPEISFWLYFVPVSIFFLGLFNVLSYFNNRLKTYKDIARATVYKAVVQAFVQLGVGYLKAGATGLISGNILSGFVANLRLMKNILSNKTLTHSISFDRMQDMAKRYRNFPKFSMWAILANSLSVHLINLIITPLYNAATLGLYYMVQRVLGLPIALVSNSVSQVFLQEASKEKQDTGRSTKSFLRILKKMLLIGIPSFTILYFVIEFVFVFFLGDDWAVAGTYAQLLVPFFFVKFVSSPMGIMMIVFEKQKMELFVNLLLITGSVATIMLTNSFIDFLYWFTIVMSILYLSFILYYYRISKGGTNE
jgi:O-antigen/teichoic acid export membrane protein